MAQQPAANANNPQPRPGPVVNPDRQLFKVRFSPCGRFVAAGCQDSTVRRWEVGETTLSAMPNLAGHHGWVQALAFHPDRRRLFTADSWGEIRSWAYADRATNPIRSTMANAHDGWVRDLAISADGRTLASCGRDKKVCLWSVEDGRKLHEMTDHNDDVYCLAFHPDGRSLVSGDLHGNVKQWETATGRKMRDFDCRSLHLYYRLQDLGGVRCLVFDAAGRTLACCGGRPGNNGQIVPTMLLFDWEAGRLQHTMNVGDAQSGFVFDLAFHPRGFVMGVTSGQPGNGKFFFHRPGEQTPFFLHTAMPNCHGLAVHPEGRRLIVAATNSGSNGNGRPLRNGEYPGNFSPLHLWTIPT